MQKVTALGVATRATLTSSIFATIKQAIISGGLPPGTRLTEKYLTEQLEVSRGPVREAITRLVHEGYLRGKPYQGYRVNRPTPTDVRDTYEVLISLAKLAFELALQRADDHQIGVLVSLVDMARDRLAIGDAEGYSSSSRELCRRAAEYSQNIQLATLEEQYRDHSARVQPWAIDDLESVRRRAFDFAALREAIQNREGIAAGNIVVENLQNNLQEVLAELTYLSPES
jgi:DNA-binding GntR family transcriptional regulator